MRRRDRDGDREKDRPRDRNRDRGHRDRGSRRPKESEKTNGQNSGDASRPAVVLLKRPETFATVTGSSSSAPSTKESKPPAVSKRDAQQTTKEFNQSGSSNTVILRRSGPGPTLRAESFPDLRGAVEATPSLPSISNDSPCPEFKIQTKPSIQLVSTPSTPKPAPQIRVSALEHAIPLINASDKMTVTKESELNFITSNSNSQDFFVITAVGKPQTGKSSILSYLATGDKFGGKQIFTSRAERECSIYMTSNNVIFIEMSSVFNGAVANDMIALMGPQGTLEIASISWNMRIMSWAFSVSHVVLIVSEDIIDPNIFQLINSSAMVHPIDSVFGDGIVAELVYICNKASSSLVEDDSVLEVAESIFNLNLGRTPSITKNFYALPHLQWTTLYSKFEELKDRIEDFCRYNRAVFFPEVNNIKRYPQNITLSEWLQGSTRIWEEIGFGNQSPGFSSYVKLLP